eukprot:COSAG02_NODE_717_length_18070_cov_20.762700_7_plen_593_part_00
MDILRAHGLLSSRESLSTNPGNLPMAAASNGVITSNLQRSIPVWSCVSGRLLGDATSSAGTVAGRVVAQQHDPIEDLVLHLLDSLALQPVQWEQTVQCVTSTTGQRDEQAWALVDFGPGGGCNLQAVTVRLLGNESVALYFVEALALGSSWLDWVRGIEPSGGKSHEAVLDSKAQTKAAQQSKNARRQKMAARALVTIESDHDGSGAHSWWACSLVCGAMGRPQPLRLESLHEAAAVIYASAFNDSTQQVDGVDVARAERCLQAQPSQVFLLTPYQAHWMGLQIRTSTALAAGDTMSSSVVSATDGQPRGFEEQPAAADVDLDSQEATTDQTRPLARLAVPAEHYSDEYVYSVQALMERRDRSFRKACRRMDAVLLKENLQLSVHTGAAVTKALIGSCMRCRNVWERLRAADRLNDDHGQQAEDGSGDSTHGNDAGKRSTKPPPKRNYYLSSLMSRRLLKDGRPNPDVAIFVILRSMSRSPNAATSEAQEKQATPTELVAAYLLTERVGRTIVSVDGVHDYSVEDSRADPSAWLLHVASKWWSESCDDAATKPVWFNDGPVPTPGLLRYKSQYHGQLQHLLSLKLVHGKTDS